MPKGFEKPNHTQTPNSFFMRLPEIKSVSELKILLAIIRRTFGWHKESDKISLSQLETDTGLTRESVSQGIQSALEHGFIKRKRDGQGHIYSLKVVGKTDQSEKPTSQAIRPKVVKKSDQQVVGNSDPQKKEIKETKESEELSPHARMMDFLQVKYGPIANGAKEGRAIKWLLEHGYDPLQCEACFDFLAAQDWRTAQVSWITVQTNIGSFLNGGNGNGNGHKPTASGRRIDQLKANAEYLRSLSGGNHN